MIVDLCPPGAAFPSPPPGIEGFIAAPVWAGLLERHYRVAAPLFVAREGENAIGACLAYHHRGAGAAATLFIPRFALWGRDASVKRALIQAAADHAAARGMRRGVAALEDAPGDGWRGWEKTTITLDVQADEAAMFAALRKKSRYTIRKAAEVFELATGSEHLDAFHAIYNARMAEKGLAFYSLDFLRDAMASVAGLDLLVARRQGMVEAGMLFFTSGHGGCYLLNGASPQALADNANHLLMWEAMKRFGARGVTRLDLGESLPEGGVFAFKTVQFGGVPAPVAYADPLCADTLPPARIRLPMALRLAHRLGPLLPGPVRRRCAEMQRDYGRVL